MSECNAEHLLYRAAFILISLAATKLLKGCLVVLKRWAEVHINKGWEEAVESKYSTEGFKIFFTLSMASCVFL